MAATSLPNRRKGCARQCKDRGQFRPVAQPGKARIDLTPCGPLGGDTAEFPFALAITPPGHRGSWAPVGGPAAGIAIAPATG